MVYFGCFELSVADFRLSHFKHHCCIHVITVDATELQLNILYDEVNVVISFSVCGSSVNFCWSSVLQLTNSLVSILTISLKSCCLQ